MKPTECAWKIWEIVLNRGLGGRSQIVRIGTKKEKKKNKMCIQHSYPSGEFFFKCFQLLTIITEYVFVIFLHVCYDKFRFEKLYSGRKRFKTDGLNNLEYRIITLKQLPLFTYLLVDLTGRRSWWTMTMWHWPFGQQPF